MCWQSADYNHHHCIQFSCNSLGDRHVLYALGGAQCNRGSNSIIQFSHRLSAPSQPTCPHCGAVVSADAKFCRACGKAIEPSAAQARSVLPKAVPPSQQPSPEGATVAPPPTTKKSRIGCGLWVSGSYSAVRGYRSRRLSRVSKRLDYAGDGFDIDRARTMRRSKSLWNSVIGTAAICPPSKSRASDKKQSKL